MEKVFVMPINSLPKSFIAKLDDADEYDEWESDYPGEDDEN